MEIGSLTILATVAYTALKALAHGGGAGPLLEILEGLAGHVAGSAAHLDLEELRGSINAWFQGPRPDNNRDLEKAAARAALHANFFCLMEGIGETMEEPKGGRIARWKKCAWERCPDSLKGPRISDGLFKYLDKAQLKAAKADCESELKKLETDFRPTNLDIDLFKVSATDGAHGAALADKALKEIEGKHGQLSERVQAVFRERWFYYLYSSFHHEIKHNTPVYRIFTIELIRDEAQKTRDHTTRVVEGAVERLVVRPAKERVAPYASVPPLQGVYLERPELTPLIELLLRQEGPVGLTAVGGMGGVGKTELAKALCHDRRVRERFPDGIVWIQGQRESGSGALDRMKTAGEALNADTSQWTNENCALHYRSALGGKAALIVLDDVWSEADVEPFLPDADGCRLLFTTREKWIAGRVGAKPFDLEVVDDEQAVKFLAAWSGREVDGLPAAAKGIVKECGGVVKALATIGAGLNGARDGDWARDYQKLSKGTLPEPVARATQVSLERVTRGLRERYLKLAVLLEDMAAALELLRALWDVDEGEAADTARELERRSLAERVGDGIRVHDLQLDYIRGLWRDREGLELIHGAVRLSSHVVARDPGQFRSQMTGRLLAHRERESVRKFVATMGTPRAWLRPEWAALDAPGGPLRRTLEGHTAGVSGVAVSADGKVAVSASGDRTLKVWDVERGTLRRTLEGHTAGVWGVGVSADGKVAVSASGDRTLKVWDVERGEALATFTCDGAAGCCALAGDGSILVGDAGGRVHLLRLEGGAAGEHGGPAPQGRGARRRATGRHIAK